MKIVLLESLRVSQEKLDALVQPLLKAGHTFEAYERAAAEQQIQHAQDADVIVLANMPLKRDVLSHCKNLKMIDVGFTGIDHVDTDYAREHGITVCNAAGYSTSTVAELAVGNAIALLRRVRENEARCRDGKAADPVLGCELGTKTVGIVGFGAIGSYTAQLFHGFGCKILAYMPRPKQTPDYVESVSLKELMQRSDIISLHCPMNDSTRGLIGKEQLALAKAGAILINVARGGVVDTQALADALNSGRLAGAAIDVFENEPPLASDHPLMHTPNTLLTPHIAFASEESMNRRAEIVFHNLEAWLAGKPENVKV